MPGRQDPISDGARSPRFEPVRRDPRLSDKVADLILRSITVDGIRPGHRLPSERELCDQFGVSRTVVREAVRSLVGKGVLESGPGKGVRVATVGPEIVRESFGLFLRTGSLDFAKVHEVRATIEVEVAGLAAERAGDEDIAMLRATWGELAEANGVEEASLANVRFHRAIAKITHNEMFLLMLDSIEEVLMEVRRSTMAILGRPELALDAHLNILKPIEARDVSGARAAMRQHLDEVKSIWLETHATLPVPASSSEQAES